MDTKRKERVFKIKYPDCIRRVTFEYNSEHRRWYPSCGQFLLEIVGRCGVRSGANLRITYQDADGDLVTFSEHQDMIDILERQSMNPVLIQVTLVEESRRLGPWPNATNQLATEVLPPATPADEHLSLKQLLRKLSSNLESVKTQIQSYQAFPENGKSAAKIIGLVEDLLEMMTIATSVLSLVVKAGQLRQL